MFNVKKLINPNVDTDMATMGEDNTPSTMVMFHLLVTIVSLIINYENKGIKTFNELLDNLLDEGGDEIEELVFKLLTYIKVTSATIEDLLDEDEEVSKSELEDVRDLLIERIGEGSIYDFVEYALNNPDLPDSDVDMDSVEMDWAFYPNANTCKKGMGDKKNPLPDGFICAVGTSTSKNRKKGSTPTKGFWRYPKSLISGNYRSKGETKKTKAFNGLRGGSERYTTSRKLRTEKVKGSLKDSLMKARKSEALKKQNSRNIG